MAFPVVASSTSDGSKPSGLAVGDLLFGWVTGASYSSGTSVPSAPAGWTTLRIRGSGTSSGFGSFYKIADAADVAASSFSFGGGNKTVVILLRITNPDPTNPIDTSNDAAASASASLSTPGITPAAQQLLLMCAGATKGNNGGAMGLSAYAIASNNPTWTEVQEARTSDSGNDADGALAWANQTAAGGVATGTATATCGSIADTDLQIIAIRAPIITVPVLSMATSVFQPVYVRIISVALLTLASAVIDPVMSIVATVWSFGAKTSEAWTFKNKNLP